MKNLAKTTWIASFFTYKNIHTLKERNAATGECMHGAFFRASDMVLIDVGSKERIYEMIDYLLENDEFEQVFSRCADE